MAGDLGQKCELPSLYKHIESNEFVYRKHKKQTEEDLAICTCKYNAGDPESACGYQCLNVLTSTECTPGYCPSGSYCRNQRFQKCQYAKSKLFRSEGRGWGLLADENIKAGQLINEYCGEVISWKEAKRRSQTYESEGLRDAYIIYLNAYESIDATKKGSLARFINHSCLPNCETRKWNVLGEVRVGIFAKQDIPAGTELSYDYNFEWYGGAKVRCLCGALCCSGFLGAKSRGFQESTYNWEDDDERYSIENVPLYDSEDDEPTSKLLKAIVPIECTSTDEKQEAIDVEPLDFLPMEVDETKTRQDAQKNITQKNALISRIRSNSSCRNYHIDTSPISKTPVYNGRSKAKKHLDVKHVCDHLASTEAREEIFACEAKKKQATDELDALYNEIRPAVEEHERDNQGSVSTSLAVKWINASCNKMKAEFNLSLAIIKNIANNHKRPRLTASPEGEAGNEIKYLENGHA